MAEELNCAEKANGSKICEMNRGEIAYMAVAHQH